MPENIENAPIDKRLERLEQEQAFYVNLGRDALTAAGVFDPSTLSDKQQQIPPERLEEIRSELPASKQFEVEIEPLSGEQPYWPEVSSTSEPDRKLSPLQRLRQFRVNRNAKKLKDLQPERVRLFGEHPLEMESKDDLGEVRRYHIRHRKFTPLTRKLGKRPQIEVWGTSREKKVNRKANRYQRRIERLTLTGRAARRRSRNIAYIRSQDFTVTPTIDDEADLNLSVDLEDNSNENFVREKLTDIWTNHPFIDYGLLDSLNRRIDDKEKNRGRIQIKKRWEDRVSAIEAAGKFPLTDFTRNLPEEERRKIYLTIVGRSEIIAQGYNDRGAILNIVLDQEKVKAYFQNIFQEFNVDTRNALFHEPYIDNDAIDALTKEEIVELEKGYEGIRLVGMFAPIDVLYGMSAEERRKLYLTVELRLKQFRESNLGEAKPESLDQANESRNASPNTGNQNATYSAVENRNRAILEDKLRRYRELMTRLAPGSTGYDTARRRVYFIERELSKKPKPVLKESARQRPTKDTNRRRGYL